MTNGAAALFMRTAYQNAAIYFGDTPLGGSHRRADSPQSGLRRCCGCWPLVLIALMSAATSTAPTRSALTGRRLRQAPAPRAGAWWVLPTAVSRRRCEPDNALGSGWCRTQGSPRLHRLRVARATALVLTHCRPRAGAAADSGVSRKHRQGASGPRGQNGQLSRTGSRVGHPGNSPGTPQSSLVANRHLSVGLTGAAPGATPTSVSRWQVASTTQSFSLTDCRAPSLSGDEWANRCDVVLRSRWPNRRFGLAAGGRRRGEAGGFLTRAGREAELPTPRPRELDGLFSCSSPGGRRSR